MKKRLKIIKWRIDYIRRKKVSPQEIAWALTGMQRAWYDIHIGAYPKIILN